MEKFINYLLILLIAAIGLMMLAFGIYSLITATSNIASFRLIGLAPSMLGLTLIGIAIIYAIEIKG